MSAWSAVYGIVARDLARTTRQTSRLLGGLARPFMWLLLVGTGYNAIARLEGGLPYQAFVFPGVVVMAALFGGMLTAIVDGVRSRVRHAAADAGEPGRARGGAAGAGARGERWSASSRAGSCSPCAPLVVPVTGERWLAGAGGAGRRRPR